MLEIAIVVLVVLWLLGAFVVPIGTSAIHLLVVLALVILAIRIVRREPL
jgi:hypothetical protein